MWNTKQWACCTIGFPFQPYTICNDFFLGDQSLPGRVQANPGRNGRGGTIKQKHLGIDILEDSVCKVKLLLSQSSGSRISNISDNQNTTDKGND